jgi:hypothetical protein
LFPAPVILDHPAGALRTTTPKQAAQPIDFSGHLHHLIFMLPDAASTTPPGRKYANSVGHAAAAVGDEFERIRVEEWRGLKFSAPNPRA